MKNFAIALASISFLLLILGLVYKKTKRSVLSEPIIALASGILLSPYVLNVLNMKAWGSFEKIMEVATQLTISMGLMATAFRIPKSYIAHHKGLQSVFILGGMLGMCALSTLLLRLIFGYQWLLCLLIGAVITPTDPVIASTIVSGETAQKLLPGRIRSQRWHGISTCILTSVIHTKGGICLERVAA